MRLKGRGRRAWLCPIIGFTLLLASPLRAQQKIPVIIDTDPAMGVPFHDVDDGLMLIVALNSPELEILGVTAAWGNDRQAVTYEKAKEILAAAGRGDVPCFAGARSPRDLGRETPASKFIAATVLGRPGKVVILAVGTLTNVATAIKSDPQVAPAIQRIVSMGGTLAPPGRWPLGAMLDLNYGADVNSAKIVIESGTPFFMIHSALCRQVLMSPEKYQRMVSTAPNLRELIARQCRNWHLLNNLGVQVPGRPGFVPWDVVALAYLLHPEWFHDNWVRAEMDDSGFGRKTVVVRRQGLAPGSGIDAPDQITAPDKFWEWFFERI